MSLTITLQRTAYTANDSINAEAFNNQSALSASIAEGGSYLFGLGSLGAPSVGFIGDADTGLYSPGADRLALVTGGVARLTVSAAGAVTIPGAITASGGLAGNVTGNVAGTLTAPLGAVGTPSVAFTGDTNTGLYSPGADQLALVTAGVARLTMNAAGAVTIPGTITASGGLTGNVTGNVAGTLAAPLGAVGTPSVAFSGDANTGLYSPGADQLALVTGGAARLTVGAAGAVTIPGGNVGIGTATPTARLDVSAASAPQTPAINLIAAGVSSVGDGAAISFLHTNSERTYRIYSYATGANAGSLRFARGTSVGYTDTLTLDSTGNVGIGTTSPAARLDLGATIGVAEFVYRDDGANAGLGVNLSGGSAEFSLFAGGNNDAAGRLSFGRRRVDTGSYTERMAIDGATGAVRFNAYGAGLLATNASGDITATNTPTVTSLAATGSITVNSGASPAGTVRNITISTAAPSGGADGDVWLQYTP